MRYKVNIQYSVTVKEVTRVGTQKIEDYKEKNVLYQGEIVAPSQEIAVMVAIFNLETKEDGRSPQIREIEVTSLDSVLTISSAS